MSDSLRDRIASAITGIRIQRDGDAYQMADAVIAELKVHQQWRADFGYDGYANCGTRDEAKVRVDEFNEALGGDVQDGEQAIVMCRYVTDWRPE